MLLFRLWFQDKHATLVQFTTGNHSHNMPAEFTIFFLYCMTISCFLAKMCLLLLYIRDLFHVYLNTCEFHFLRLHVNKKINFDFS